MNAPAYRTTHFSPSHDRQHASAPERRQPERDDKRAHICRGIVQGEFNVFYQPIVDVARGVAVGAEALLRWHHPTLGFLTPASFEPLLRDAEVAWAVTEFVVYSICRDLAQSGDRFISFNVYPSQLRGGRLRKLIETRHLARGGAPEALTIELLESEPRVACAGLAKEVEALRAMGLRVAIDDFGCGVWTLEDLAHIKVDVVKLAREMIRDVPTSDDASRQAARTLRALSATGVQTVVEGVETPGHLAWVTTMPNVWAQGYAFARPQPTLEQAIGAAQSAFDSREQLAWR